MKFFFNIMKTWTGRNLTVDAATPIHAADVFVANTIANPIPIVLTLPVYGILQTIFNDNASTNITSATWVELATLTSDIAKLQLSYTAGQPLEFGTGATIGVVTRRFLANQGEGPLNLDFDLASGQKIWVRSLAATVSTGYLTVNLIGLI